jgi:hypothetical protein
VIYLVIKTFNTLEEADRFAESVTEDDIVAVIPLEEAAEASLSAGTPVPVASAASSSGRWPIAPDGELSPPPETPLPPAPKCPRCGTPTKVLWHNRENTAFACPDRECEQRGREIPGYSVKVPPA